MSFPPSDERSPFQQELDKALEHRSTVIEDYPQETVVCDALEFEMCDLLDGSDHLASVLAEDVFFGKKYYTQSVKVAEALGIKRHQLANFNTREAFLLACEAPKPVTFSLNVDKSERLRQHKELFVETPPQILLNSIQKMMNEDTAFGGNIQARSLVIVHGSKGELWIVFEVWRWEKKKTEDE